MRTYRVLPTVLAVAALLGMGSMMVLWVGPGAVAPAGTPVDEAWLLYFALVYEKERPESLGTEDLKQMLISLHPKTEAVAGRFAVSSYSSTQGDFDLVVRHRDGSTFRITRLGVDGG